MSIRFKGSVKFGDFKARLLFALLVAEEVYAKHGQPEMWITSLDDSRHMAGSKHYTGDGADLRTISLPGGPVGATARAIHAELKSRLAPEFDVILEGDHIHLEYDPG